MMLLTLLQAALACQLFGHATSTPVGSRHAQVKTPCKHGPDSRNCWGEYSIDTDYLDTTPDTGVTREYWLNPELITIAPDGYEMQALAMNGSIPGPTIEADWGDEIVIHVTNNIPENGYTPPLPPGDPDVQAGLTNWPLGPRSIGMVFGSSIPIRMTVRRPLSQVKKRGAKLTHNLPTVRRRSRRDRVPNGARGDQDVQVPGDAVRHIVVSFTLHPPGGHGPHGPHCDSRAGDCQLRH